MKNKILIYALAFFTFGNSYAQNKEQNKENENKTYIKANAIFLPIGIINAGIEHQIASKYTIQGDILISPWKSFASHELQYYSVSFEGRYYFKEAFNHWFLGANISASAFKMHKWNYWNDNNYWDKDTQTITPYINSNIYQKGFSFLVGITGGYQFNLGKNWNMELYATFGNSQDFYKGYDRPSGDRYDSAKKWNKSGEWVPYRGGVMISYKLK